MSNITINTKDVEQALDKIALQLTMNVKRSLEECGLVAEGYAKQECPVDTGNLRNSITHKVSDGSVQIGTNVEYAPYVEYGTGVHSTMGGRQTPWAFEKDGKWYMTSGQEPHPFMKPALANHIKEYRDIFMKNIMEF